MNASFNLSKFRTVSADFGVTIKLVVTDTRVPSNPFKGEFTLIKYNEIVDFFKEHEHIFAMNVANERFR